MHKVIVLALSIICGLLSCIKENNRTTARTYTYTAPVIPIPDTSTVPSRSFLALGDSYTIGQSVIVADRFPVQTVKYLKEQGVAFRDPEIIAQTGVDYWKFIELA